MPEEEELEKLREITDCLGPKIMENAVVFRGCVESGHLVSTTLNKLGISHRRVYGKVKSLPDRKELDHCWIETDDFVIETNPSQILGIDVGALALKKDTWRELTEPQEAESFFVEVPLTPAGKRFYDTQAEQVLRCFRGKQ